MFVKSSVLYVGKGEKEVSGQSEGRHSFIPQNRPDVISGQCSVGPSLAEGLWKFVLHFPPQGSEKGGNRFISESNYIVWTL